MPQLVTMGAQLTCVQGTAPSNLIVPVPTVAGEVKPAANIMDNKPIVNIPPFGTCNILTSAASGVPTPGFPAIAAPWPPGNPTVMIRGQPALNNSSTCTCTIGGAISIANPSATKEMV